jgi:sulfoxide reductase heme-binding subunit YedZ
MTVGRMLPWILGRGLGLAAFLAFLLATSVGLWLHHPWRSRLRWPDQLGQIRLHAWLAAAALMLTVGHVLALALDRYAGVGWAGAFVPGRSGYRPLAVALGTVALYLALLAVATAALAGRLFRRSWLRVHRIAAACFAMAWWHGVWAGSDVLRLRPLYLAAAALVVPLAVTRHLARGNVPDTVHR